MKDNDHKTRSIFPDDDDDDDCACNLTVTVKMKISLGNGMIKGSNAEPYHDDVEEEEAKEKQ